MRHLPPMNENNTIHQTGSATPQSDQTQPTLFKVPIAWRCPLCGTTQDIILDTGPVFRKCPCKEPVLFNIIDPETGYRINTSHYDQPLHV